MALLLWSLSLVVGGAMAQLVQEDGYYAPQTFNNQNAGHGLFKPAQDADPQPQNRLQEAWRPNVAADPWKPLSKEQQANIIHHKQALTKDGSFRYEFSSDNGVAAGEVIEPDGSRVGAFQYKDPSGQLVKLKYRAGKEGFQILEGSHLPKSPEPIAYPQQGAAYQEAFNQQRQQFQLQQNYNQNPQPQQLWTQNRGPQVFQNAGNEDRSQAPAAGNQYFNQNWAASARRDEREDDGQYRENDIESEQLSKGPHDFGEGYSFEFGGPRY